MLDFQHNHGMTCMTCVVIVDAMCASCFYQVTIHVCPFVAATAFLQMEAGKTKSLWPFARGAFGHFSTTLLYQKNVGTGRSSFMRTALQLLLSLPMCVFEVMGADRC